MPDPRLPDPGEPGYAGAGQVRRPVLIMTSTLAGLSVFVSGTAFIDVVPRWVSGLAGLTVAALTVGWGVFTQGLVTPTAAVAARRTPSGQLVAGPAAPTTAEGAPVHVSGTPTRPGGPVSSGT